MHFILSFRVWSVPNEDSVYQISFCGVIPSCNNASVCKIDSTNKKIKLGEKTDDAIAGLAADGSGFTTTLSYGDICENNLTYKSEIYFICGKTLVGRKSF